MKYVIIFCFLLEALAVTAQGSISKLEMSEIKKKVEIEAITYRDSIKKADLHITDLDLDFLIDVYRVESLSNYKILIDDTTTGMSTAVYELNQDYDGLLNKYYNILLEKLQKEDVITLKISQRNWIKFRDAEIDLIRLISKEEYSGGGTIQNNIRAANICNLTRSRLYEIKGHLNEFML